MSQDKSRFVLPWGPTAWSKIFAGRGPGDAAQAARQELLLRYHAVVYEYGLLRLHDESAARQLYSEFAIRLLENDRLVRNAAPGRGRFRHYLQKTLRHIIVDFCREKGKLLARLPDEIGSDGGADSIFQQAWKHEVITQAWKALEEHEHTTGQLCYSVLLPAAEKANLSSRELAEVLTGKFARPFTEAGVRKLRERARERFAGLLVQEVQQSLGSPTRAELEDELRALELYDICAPALRPAGGAAAERA